MAVSIPQGYQQTEVGVIPDDWEVKPLHLLTTLMTNGFVGTAKTHYTESSDGVLYIQGYNVQENDFNFNGIKRVTRRFHKQHKKSSLRAGDLLTVQTGDVGLTALVPKTLEGANCHALIITRFKKDFESTFFSYYLNSEQGRNRLREIETGTTMKHINVGDLLYFLVPFSSSKAEQTAIANALSDADTWIQSLTRLIVKKRRIKQGTMQRLLNPYEDGVLKEGWVVKELGDVADILTGFPFPSSGYVTQGVRLLRGSNIKRGETDWSEHICQYWRKATVEIKKYELELGDIVVAMDGSLVGRSFAQVKNDDLPSLLLQRVARIRPKSDKYNVDYLKEWVCSEIFTDHCDALKTVTAIPHISPADIDSFKLGFPAEIEEQTRIATILSDMDSEITQLETKLTKAKTLKQGMMQNLLTGKIRLVEPEAHRTPTPCLP